MIRGNLSLSGMNKAEPGGAEALQAVVSFCEIMSQKDVVNRTRKDDAQSDAISKTKAGARKVYSYRYLFL